MQVSTSAGKRYNNGANRSDNRSISTNETDEISSEALFYKQKLITKSIIKPIIITTGEPSGIGMDVVLELAKSGYLKSLKSPVLVTASDIAMNDRLMALQRQPSFGNNKETNKLVSWQTVSLQTFNLNKTSHDDTCDYQKLVEAFIKSLADNENDDMNNNCPDFYLLDMPTVNPVVMGQVDTKNSVMVLSQLELAHQLASKRLSGNNLVSAIVTAPLQKSALIDAKLTLPDGTMFSGHTEYFMQMSHCDKVVMMLANTKLKVALVTTHLPLSQVAAAITKNEVRQTVRIVLDSLINQFAIDRPKVLVCGLNPHAGEGGHLGTEEIEIINPVLHEFIEQGYDISLAMPADTLFTDRYIDNCDAIIAMYHDQGLPVLKSHGFGDSVNLTLGLPYVRTSVDHGTAIDLAGTGKASASSLKQAINYAMKMSH